MNPCRNPKCEYFNRSLPVDARNCPFCGQPLKDTLTGSDPEPSDEVIPSVPSSSRPRLKLVHTTGREFHLRHEMAHIGRSSPANLIKPEIDLRGIPHDGVVSRGAHARIYWDGNQNCYVIVDNSSRNGTFLDGILLKSDTPYRLKPNAMLQLGQDELVYFRVVIG
jgi:hypothetical protein